MTAENQERAGSAARATGGASAWSGRRRSPASPAAASWEWRRSCAASPACSTLTSATPVGGSRTRENDVGTEYRSAIFPQTPEQQATAERVIARVNASGKWKRPITTSIEPAATWYSAEQYHQDYLRRNPGGYTCHYLRE